MTKAGLAVLAILAVIGCAGPSPSTSPAGPTSSPTDEPVAYRLVAAFDRGAQWAYTVRVATSDAEWSALWTELSPGLAEPEIDLATNIAVVFADGTGGPGNCSERRLDGVVIDPALALVFARIVDPLAPRGCDAMLGGSSVFVVALARAVVPQPPVTIQLSEECLGCDGTGRIVLDEL